MTELLEKAFAVASRLPDDEQDAVATIVLTELSSEAHWRQAFANSEDKLAQLADEALEEFRAGKTTPLDEGLG